MINILIVAIGGGIGAASRYLVSSWAAERFGSGFPYGTLIVNVAGCFIIGLFLALVTDKIVVKPEWRLFVTTGFLGGLTTFSSFSYETMKLLQEADISLAVYNVLANCVIGFLATWVGINFARYLTLS
ncbi:MAG TPA: fluoride efflux transporter CrcB [Sporomusa sp.]|nr:fluoride efflux transporter CrcB [Sporomusa sp.]HWR44210.1 fluoride efflux transporter CrcB [Sporomusa sp.]